MTNNKGYSSTVITVVVIGALVLGIGGYQFTKSYYNNRDNKHKDVAISTCQESPDYFVISRADLTGNAGDDILVKYKSDKQENFDCNYEYDEGDFELLNSDADGIEFISSAQHFSFIKENLIIIDEGTGSQRSFKIYDLDEQKEIFADDYSLGLFELNDNILSYWRKTNDKPNKENCAKVNEYNDMGGAKIEGKIALDIFDTSTVKEFTDFKCSVVE